MTPYEKLRAKRNEMFLVTMKFFNGIRNKELIMMEEVSLNDILMMLGHIHGEYGVEVRVWGDYKIQFNDIQFKLDKPLSEQEEVCKQLNKLL